MPVLQQKAGGGAVVLPQVVTNIELGATGAVNLVLANGRELQASYHMAADANATLRLPAGMIYASGAPLNQVGPAIIKLDERHAGLTIEGAGRGATVLADPYAIGVQSVPIQISSRRITNSVNGDFKVNSLSFSGITPGAMDEFEVGALAYFWTFNTTKNRTLQRELRTITGVNSTAGTLSIDSVLTVAANNVRAVRGKRVSGAAAVGSNDIVLASAGDLGLFRVNDDVVIGDGPAINEFFCEWVTVTGVDVTNSRVYFTPPLRQAYSANFTCIVPVPNMTDITLRDLSIAAPKNSSIRYIGYVRIGRRIRLENVAFVPDGDDFVSVIHGALDVTGCGDISFVHCSIFGPSFTVCHDGLLHDITARGFGFSEYCLDFKCSSITIDGGNFLCQDIDGFGPCHRIHLRDFLALSYCVDSSDSGIRLAEGSHISNVRLTNARNEAVIYLNDDNMVLDNVRFDKEVWIGGADVRIGGLSAPVFRLRGPAGSFPASSGVLIGPIDTPQMVDSAPIGNWLQPLMVDHDGSATPWQSSDGYTPRKPGLVLPSAAQDTVPLTVQGAASQSVALQQWKDNSGTVLFTILSDGNIGTSKSTSASTLGNVVKKVPIKDSSGNLLGYLAICDNIT